MAELPTGTVTFLFTDLEGSTRLWEEFPDAMRRRWHVTTRSSVAVGSHGGYIVKTTGDGVHAAFATPTTRSPPRPRGARSRRAVAGDGPLRVRWVCTPVRPSCATATTTAPR